MNQRFLIALIILAGIGSIGSVLAYSGSISAAQGNFNNVLVTGTCTGCGGEASYSNFNTIALNTTVAGGPENDKFRDAYISNIGTAIFNGNTNNFVVKISGTATFTNSSYVSTGSKQIGQSSGSGKYAIALTDSTPAKISVFKDGNYVQDLHINMSILVNPSVEGQLAMAISPNGQYILVVASDGTSGESRVQIFQGS